MSISAQNRLKHHDLKLTQPRLKVLQAFSKSQNALSHSDLEKSLGKNFDRVTIYRILNSFEQKGIIHKVLDDSGSSKFALCEDGCAPNHHHHNHVHFKCHKCGNSECINGVEIPTIKLPEGYLTEESNLLVEGICKLCS